MAIQLSIVEKMKFAKILERLLVLLLLTGCAEIWSDTIFEERPIATYEDCVAAGNTIIRTEPPRCVTEDMQTYVKGDAPRKIPRKYKNQQDQNSEQQGLPGCQNRCGNGTCEQIVCLSLGCPCPETPKNCPQDCASQSVSQW